MSLRFFIIGEKYRQGWANCFEQSEKGLCSSELFVFVVFYHVYYNPYVAT